MEPNLLEENQAIAEINIVPFVDIILVILIIFMVTAPFVVKTGFSLDLPSASASKQIETSKQHIAIRKDGAVLLNGEVMDLKVMTDELKSLFMPPAENTHITISADENVLHGTVINVINVVKGVGFNKVAITTLKSKED